MGTKIWEIRFGNSLNRCKVVAEDIDKALHLARLMHRHNIDEAPEKYWISRAELLIESD